MKTQGKENPNRSGYLDALKFGYGRQGFSCTSQASHSVVSSHIQKSQVSSFPMGSSGLDNIHGQENLIVVHGDKKVLEVREMATLTILPGMKITRLATIEPRQRIRKSQPIGNNPRVAVIPLAKRFFSGQVRGGVGISSTERYTIQSETSKEILESISNLLGYKVTHLQVERMLSAIENGGLLPPE